MTRAAVADLEKVIGFSANPEGVVQNKVLQRLANPIHVARFDWVHSVLQGGTLVVEIEATLATTGIERSRLRSFLADETWRYPQASVVKSRALHRIFDPRRSSDDATKVKGSCAEFLGAIGMLGGKPEHAAAVRSFVAACTVVDVLLDIKAGVVAIDAGAAALQTAIKDHMDAHQSLYGDGFIRPKHHWMMDIPSQVRADGLLLDAFVIERTHLRVKAVAEPIKNTRAFEASLLASLLTVVFQGRREGDGDGLVGRTAPWHGATVADRMRVWGVPVAVDDVVSVGEQCGQVAACCLDDGHLMALVQPMTVSLAVSQHCILCRPEGGLAAWPATELRLALAWRSRPDGLVMVVRR